MLRPGTMRTPIVLLLAGCGGAAAVSARPASPPAAPVVAAPPSERQPGALAGRWRITCAENAGEVVEFKIDGDKAVGRVVATGAAARFGFRDGEDVFHLGLDPSGAWAGEVRWRGVSGAQHWDGIVLVATAHGLSASVTNEPCYRDLQRAD